MTIKLWKPEFHADTGVPIVGLAVHKVMQEGDIAEVEFSLKRKDGTRVFPNQYYISKLKALNYTRETIKGVALVKIPLHEFKEASPKPEQPIVIKVEPRNLSDIPRHPCSCFGTKFWKTPWNQWLCARCHPNPNPEFDAEIIDIAEKEEIKQ